MGVVYVGGAPGLVMGPCIVEIDPYVIREVQYQFEVNPCRNEKNYSKWKFLVGVDYVGRAPQGWEWGHAWLRLTVLS